MARRSNLDLGDIRRRLAVEKGPRYWRSLEELADAEDFRRFVEAEFPAAAPVLAEAGRRDFLRVMAASLMLGGLAACGDMPEDRAVPYVRQPEKIVPGVPRFYATAFPFEGWAQPVLAETHVGRPTKLEGNPNHPASGGATDAFTQAAILQLYDPDRSQAIRFQRRITTWERFLAALVSLRARLQASQGAGLRLLTDTVTSPTMARQIEEVLNTFPQARWHHFEPVGLQSQHAATRLAFGRALDAVPRLDRATVIVSFEDDLLGPGPAQVRNVSDWSRRRQATQQRGEITRLYVAESTPSLTGTVATERLAVAAARIPVLVAALAARLGITRNDPPDSGTGGAGLSAAERRWLKTATEQVQAHRQDTLVTVGGYHAAPVQALAHLINASLGSVGRTVVYTEPVARTARDDVGILDQLAQAIEAGSVDTLIVIGANPVYAAPADLAFAELYQRVPSRIHAGLYDDETAAHSHWHIPLAHPLESWSDARAVDGLATILQPTVQPIYGGIQVHELLAALLGRPDDEAYAIVRDTWRSRLGSGAEGQEQEEGQENAWRRALHDGVIEGTGASVVMPEFAPDALSGLNVSNGETDPGDGGGGLEIVFRADPTIWDGRFTNLGWLQELPKPLSKVTWDNVVAVSSRLAEVLGVDNGDFLVVEVGGRSVVGPAWITPGQAERTVTLYLGYGRSRAGRVGDGLGYSAYAVRASEHPWIAAGASVLRTGERTDLATTQHHFTMAGREMVRTMSLAEARSAASAALEPELPSFYPEWEYPDQAWAMAIDLDLCIGCNACIVACQAENSIPVVGREQVLQGREMHWLRVDRYHSESLDDPRFHFQPVPCMHCEKAPCEVGCPVNATVHGPEGLNQMIYNRCVGTRTCASYCPYKVRRFNFFEYSHTESPGLKAQRNPDVTVRARGVMEKCTYCVQRINAARIEAKKQGRSIREGEVQTACQSACPAGVIAFGNRNDRGSQVAQRRRSTRNYALLRELNTRPRTTYLAEIDAGGRPPDEREDEG